MCSTEFGVRSTGDGHARPLSRVGSSKCVGFDSAQAGPCSSPAMVKGGLNESRPIRQNLGWRRPKLGFGSMQAPRRRVKCGAVRAAQLHAFPQGNGKAEVPTSSVWLLALTRGRREVARRPPEPRAPRPVLGRNVHGSTSQWKLWCCGHAFGVPARPPMLRQLPRAHSSSYQSASNSPARGGRGRGGGRPTRSGQDREPLSQRL